MLSQALHAETFSWEAYSWILHGPDVNTQNVLTARQRVHIKDNEMVALLANLKQQEQAIAITQQTDCQALLVDRVTRLHHRSNQSFPTVDHFVSILQTAHLRL